MNGMEKISVREIERIVREASKLFLDRNAASHTSVKGRADFVTEVDVKVQEQIHGELLKRYPEIPFMSEEQDNREIRREGLYWVLDPVDGTTNLIYDYRASVISLALVDGDQPVLGFVYHPYLDEMFYAEKGKGAFCNGQRITVSGAEKMEHALIAIGTSPYEKKLAEKNFAVFQRVFSDALDIRRSGSAAWDLACVASGRVDGFFERNLKIWDFAAGVLLVTEAGGAVYDFSKNPFALAMVESIAAGSPAIAEALVERYLN